LAVAARVRIADADLAAQASREVRTSLHWSRLTLMANAKQEVLKLLKTLPEEASLEDIQYHLYVLQCIGRGLEDVEAGRTLPQEEVERRMARWLEK
jgi:hypothetical protein